MALLGSTLGIVKLKEDLARRTVDPDASTVGVHSQLAECQPDPGALGTLTIAPHVEVEDGRMLLRRDSGPVVGDGEPIGFGVGNYVQPDLTALLNELHRIGNQVGEDTGQHVTVALQRRQVRLERSEHDLPTPRCRRGDSLDNLVDHLRHIDVGYGQRVLADLQACRVEDVADELLHPAGAPQANFQDLQYRDRQILFAPRGEDQIEAIEDITKGYTQVVNDHIHEVLSRAPT